MFTAVESAVDGGLGGCGGLCWTVTADPGVARILSRTLPPSSSWTGTRAPCPDIPQRLVDGAIALIKIGPPR